VREGGQGRARRDVRRRRAGVRRRARLTTSSRMLILSGRFDDASFTSMYASAVAERAALRQRLSSASETVLVVAASPSTPCYERVLNGDGGASSEPNCPRRGVRWSPGRAPPHRHLHGVLQMVAHTHSRSLARGARISTHIHSPQTVAHCSL